MKNKSLFLGVLTAALLFFALTVFCDDLGGTTLTNVTKKLTMFENIEELEFLSEYETQKIDIETPKQVTDSYSASIDYDGETYSVTAFCFESPEAGWRYSHFIPTPVGDSDSTCSLNRTEHKASLSAVKGCNYYEIVCDTTDNIIGFVDFFCGHFDSAVGGAI